MRNWFYFLILLLPFTLNANEKKVPFDVPVDFSKKGTVYETDFQAPWNIWGSLVSFNLFFTCNPSIPKYATNGSLYYMCTEEEKQIKYSIDFATRDGKLIPKEENQYFKLKVTLTPLGWASNNVEIVTIDYLKAEFSGRIDGTQFSWLYKKGIWQKKEYKDDKKIEFTISIPLYGGHNDGGKTIMVADLQRLSKYHIKVESLEDVEVPDGINIGFRIEKSSTKH